MKKMLLICIGLAVIISIILTKLYSASVVQFINETPEEIERMAVLKPIEPMPVLQSTLEEDLPGEGEEELPAEVEDLREHMDTILSENEKMVVKVNPSYLDCIVEGDQVIDEKKPLKFRIPENYQVKGKLIPANTFIYSIPRIKGEEIELNVHSFHTSKGFVMLSIKAFKEDLADEVTIDSDNQQVLTDGDTILFEY
jgi:hypothetical protein